MSIEEIEIIKTQIAKMEEIVGSCQLNVYNRLQAHDVRFENIEEQFDRQTAQRKEQGKELHTKLDALQDWADNHGKEEMERIAENKAILTSLSKSVSTIEKQTKENTDFKNSEIHNREIEARVAEHIHELEKPRKDLIHKVKMTAISVITVATLGAIYKGIMLLVDLSSKMNGGY